MLNLMSSRELMGLGAELTRRKEGQFVLGRSIPVREFLRLSESQFEKQAIASFAPLAPLFQIHETRVLRSGL